MRIDRPLSDEKYLNGRAPLQAESASNTQIPAWYKSSLSTYNGNCVEIARLGNDKIGMRDTKDHGAGPVLSFSENEWNAFIAGAKAGEFDFGQ
jgi:hypothetical protein